MHYNNVKFNGAGQMELGSGFTEVTPEETAANEIAKFREALTVAAEIHGLLPGATWLDFVNAELVADEEAGLRLDAPSFGLAANSPIETIRAASREAYEVYLAKDAVEHPDRVTLSYIVAVPTPEQAALIEEERQKIIEQLSLPGETSIDDARKASLFAVVEIGRQDNATFLGLLPTATPEEVDAAQAVRGAQYAASFDYTRHTRPGDLYLIDGGQ